MTRTIPAYYHQHGAGLPVFRGGVMQKGYGLGGLFKGLLRTVTPHLKKGLIRVGQHVLQNGINVMEDVANGENFKTAAKRRVGESVNDAIQSVVSNKKKRKTYQSVSRKKTSKSRGPKTKNNQQSLGIL